MLDAAPARGLERAHHLKNAATLARAEIHRVPTDGVAEKTKGRQVPVREVDDVVQRSEQAPHDTRFLRLYSLDERKRMEAQGWTVIR